MDDAPSGDRPVAPGKTGWDAAMGFRYLRMSRDEVVVEYDVAAIHKQPYGIVHGGVLSSLAESLASAATYEAVKDEGKIAMGQANDTSYLRPISEGNINATATRRHGGRTTWLWDVELSDDDGRVCALSRMTIAVRPARG